MNGSVNVHNEHGITTIEFHHPQGNSLPAKILDELCHEIHFAGTHSETKVIILRSAGENVFCSGASFNELSAIVDEVNGKKFFTGFANVINAIRKCTKLIIGRIHGKCIGGGVGLAAACDYAIATNNAEIKLSELSIGIGPFVVGPAIERKIGLSAFSQLAIDSSLWRSADWAKHKGLFAEVHETIANMDESIFRLSNALVHYNPEAMHQLKNMFWKNTDNWDVLLEERAKITGKLVLSNYTKTAIEKFKQAKVKSIKS
jgi:methylglutaconyl-CoA hydratase